MKYDEAIELYTKAINIESHFNLYFNRGLCHLKSGNIEAAMKDATICNMQNPYWIKSVYLKTKAF